MLFVFGLSLAVAGCGQGGDEVALPVKVTPKILPDGTTVLRKANGAEPGTLDPHKARGVPAANILRDLYEGLVSEAPDGHLIPGAAKRWTISDDGTIYTFQLRRDAVWSNGEPVRAEHFVYAMRRTVDPDTASVYAGILEPIENAAAIIAGKKPPQALGVKALGPYELQIQLKAPTPYFLGLLTHSTTYPVYPPVVEQYPERFTRADYSVTNGAYTLEQWVVASKIVLAARDNYWNAANVGVDKVVYYPIANASSALKRYQAGELDWVGNLPISMLDIIREEIPGQLHVEPTLGVYYYGLNLTKPPFENAPRLRRALSLSIDRQIIVDKITRGGELPAYAWVPDVVDDYSGAEFVYADWSREKRHRRARELYQAAGYSEQNPLTVEIRYNSSEAHRKIATVIASMWRRNLGVQVNLVNEEWKVFLQHIEGMQVTEVYRAGWIGDYNDPYTFLEIMESDAGLNGTGYSNPKYDALLEQASRTPAGTERQRLLREAEAILLADTPVIPIYFYVSRRLIKPYVKGFVGNAMGHYYSRDIHVVPVTSQ